MWTIFFHRLFGPIEPCTTEFLNITYPQAKNLPDLESLMDERIGRYIRVVIGDVDRKTLPIKGIIKIEFLRVTSSLLGRGTRNYNSGSNYGGEGGGGGGDGRFSLRGTTKGGGVGEGNEVGSGATTGGRSQLQTTKRKSSGWFGSRSRSGSTGGASGDHNEIRSTGQKDDREGGLSVWETWTLNIECLPIEERQSITGGVGRGGSSSNSSGTSTGAGAKANSTGSQNSDKPRRRRTSTEYSRAVELSMKSFEECLLKIYDIVDREKDHIPPITTLDTAPFPYKIEIVLTENSSQQQQQQQEQQQQQGGVDEGWGTYIKKILD